MVKPSGMIYGDPVSPHMRSQPALAVLLLVAGEYLVRVRVGYGAQVECWSGGGLGSGLAWDLFRLLAHVRA